jgi:hypothetical protein
MREREGQYISPVYPAAPPVRAVCVPVEIVRDLMSYSESGKAPEPRMVAPLRRVQPFRPWYVAPPFSCARASPRR